jgi:hypothetical protein
MAVSRVFLDDQNLLNDMDATLKVSPWAAFIWRPDLHKYSAFTLLPTDKPDSGAYNGLVPSVPRIVYQAVEVCLFVFFVWGFFCCVLPFLLVHKVPKANTAHSPKTKPSKHNPHNQQQNKQLFTWPWQADYNNALAAKLLNPLNCLGQAATVVLQTWGSNMGIPNVRAFKRFCFFVCRRLMCFECCVVWRGRAKCQNEQPTTKLNQQPNPTSTLKPKPKTKTKPTQPVAVGSTNRIVGGGCGDGCAWQGNLAVDDIAFSMEKADLAAWVADVAKITNLDLQDGGAAPDR